MKKAAGDISADQLKYGPPLIAQREAELKTLRDMRTTMEAGIPVAQRFNQVVHWEGSQSEGQYLSYLQRKEQLTRLLNIQKQRGFYSPQQDYAFRNQEMAQRYLMNRAEQQGYATPEQYLSYLATVRHSMEQENQAWRARVAALSSATTSTVQYANAVSGSHESAQQFLSGTRNAAEAIRTLGSRAATPTASLQDDQFRADLAQDSAALQAFDAMVANPRVWLEDEAFRRVVAADRQRLTLLDKMVANPTVEIDNSQALSAIDAVVAAMARLRAEQAHVEVSARPEIPVPVPMTGGTQAGPGPPDVTRGFAGQLVERLKKTLGVNDTAYRADMIADDQIARNFTSTPAVKQIIADIGPFLADVARARAAAETITGPATFTHVPQFGPEPPRKMAGIGFTGTVASPAPSAGSAGARDAAEAAAAKKLEAQATRDLAAAELLNARAAATAAATEKLNARAALDSAAAQQIADKAASTRAANEARAAIQVAAAWEAVRQSEVAGVADMAAAEEAGYGRVIAAADAAAAQAAKFAAAQDMANAAIDRNNALYASGQIMRLGQAEGLAEADSYRLAVALKAAHAELDGSAGSMARAAVAADALTAAEARLGAAARADAIIAGEGARHWDVLGLSMQDAGRAAADADPRFAGLEGTLAGVAAQYDRDTVAAAKFAAAQRAGTSANSDYWKSLGLTQAAAASLAEAQRRAAVDATAAARSKAIDQVAALTPGGGGGAGGGGGGAGWAALGAAAGGGWGRGFWRAANAQLPLFGGAFGGTALIGSIGAISLAIHFLIDFLIVLVPAVATAAAGLGAFGLAALDAGKTVYGQLKSLHDVGDAFNQSIYPLTGNLERLHKVIQPKVFELFGVALDIAGKNAGVFNALAIKTGDVLVNMFTKFDAVLSRNKDAIGNFFKVGAYDLSQFASIGRSIGSVFTELLLAGEKTQVAEKLLHGVAIAFHAVADVAKAVPQPVLVAAIAFFSLVHYGGALVTVFDKAGIALAGFISKIPGLSGAASSLAGGLNASNAQLAMMGGHTRQLDSIAAGIAAGSQSAVSLGKDLGISEAGLVKIVSKNPEIKALASTLGLTATNVAGTAVAMAKAGDGADKLATHVAGGEKAMAGLKTAAGDVSGALLNIAAGTGAATERNLSALAGNLENAGKSAESSAGKSGIFAGALSNLSSKASSAGEKIGGFLKSNSTNLWLIAAAAVAVMVIALANAKSAADLYVDAAQKAEGALPISALAVSLVREQVANNRNLAGATRVLNDEASKQFATYTSGTPSAKDYYDQVQRGVGITRQQAASSLEATISFEKYHALQGTLINDQNNYNLLLKASGGQLSDLAAVGITSNDVINAGTNSLNHYTVQMQQLIIKVQAELDAQKALALGSGRSAAAINAEAFAAGDASNKLGSMQGALGNITKAEDALFNVLIGGEQAFNSFAIGLNTMNKDAAGVAGGIDNLGAAGLKLAGDFYNVVLPAAQKQVDALQMQDVSTGNLQTATATMARTMLHTVGSSRDGRVAIIDLINNALGPGTVSFKNLDQWVGQNSTTMGGFRSIVDSTQASASRLSGVIKDSLVTMMSQASLHALGGQKAFSAFADGVLNGTGASAQFKRSAGDVLKTLEIMYKGDLPKTQKAFIDWAMNGLGLSHAQADSMWHTMTTKLQPALTQSGIKANIAKTAFEGWANHGLKVGGAQADALWKEINTKLGPSLGGLGDLTLPASKKAFLDWAGTSKGKGGLGLGQQKATDLYNELVGLQKQIDLMDGRTLPASQKSFQDWARNSFGYSATVAGNLTSYLFGPTGLGPGLARFGDLSLPANQKKFQEWAHSSFGYSKAKVYELWQQAVILQSQLGVFDTKTLPSSASQFAAWARTGVDIGKQSASKLWSEITSKLGPGLDSLGNLSLPANEKKFQDWASSKGGLGLSKAAAKNLWIELSTLQGEIDAMHGTNIPITTTYTTHGTPPAGIPASALQGITGVSTAGRPGVSAPLPGHRQHGGPITQGTTPTADDVHIMASKDEWVIKALSARKYGHAAMDAVNQGTAVIMAGMGMARPGKHADGGPVGVGSAHLMAFGGMVLPYADGGMVTGMAAGGAVVGKPQAAASAGDFSAASEAWDKLWGKASTGFDKHVKTGTSKFLGTEVPALLATTGKGWLDTWAKAAGDYSKQVVGPVTKFHEGAIPALLATTGKEWLGTWNKAQHDHHDQVVAPVTKFHEATIPSLLTGTGKEWLGTWNKAQHDHHDQVVSPVTKFHDTTIPSLLTGTGKDWLTTWNKAQHDHHDQVVSPVTKFHSATIPSLLTGTGRDWLTTWNKAQHDHHDQVITPVTKFHAATIPALLTGTSQHWLSTWNTAQHVHHDQIIAPVTQFHAATIPSLLTGTGQHWRGTWTQGHADFGSIIQTPLQSWFGGPLPSSITGGMKSGMRAAVAHVINPQVDFINKDLLANLPGALRVGHVAQVAAGGVPYAVGSIPGAGEDDTHLARLMPGEFVVRKPARMALESEYGRGWMDHLNQADSWLSSGSQGTLASQGMAAGGSQGHPFASGGVYMNPLRAANPVAGRIDMGVDYTVHGPIYALGPSVIKRSTASSGWPGGGDIIGQLTAGPESGRHWFVAEDVVPARGAGVGASVGPTTIVGFAGTGGAPGPWIETGWANPNDSGTTLAQMLGQSSPTGDPGAFTTAAGVDYSNLLHSLGAPAGIPSGPVHGKLPFSSGRGGGGGGAPAQSLGQIEGLLAASAPGSGVQLTAAHQKLSAHGVNLSRFFPGGIAGMLKAASSGVESIWKHIWPFAVQPKVDLGPASVVGGAANQAGAFLENKGILSFMAAQDAKAKAVQAQQQQAAAAAAVSGGGAAPASGISGVVAVSSFAPNPPSNYAIIGKYFEGLGYSKIATAGILGNIAAESGGNPEQREFGHPGNGGLIGFTPMSAWGVTITGNANADMAQQLRAAANFPGSSPGAMNAASRSPAAAADWYVTNVEHAGVPAFSRREASAQASFNLGWAAGGRVYGAGGPTDDDVPAMLSNDEWVINAASVKSLQRDYGSGIMDAINGYDSGGSVPSGGQLGTSVSGIAFAGSSPGTGLAMAAGGPVLWDAALKQSLRSQTGERAAYMALASKFPARISRATPMGLVAAQQSIEQGDYARLSSATARPGDMTPALFNSMAAELKTYNALLSGSKTLPLRQHQGALVNTLRGWLQHGEGTTSALSTAWHAVVNQSVGGRDAALVNYALMLAKARSAQADELKQYAALVKRLTPKSPPPAKATAAVAGKPGSTPGAARTMFDSANPGLIPSNAKMVAGYITGGPGSNWAGQWGRFAGKPEVRIVQRPRVYNEGDVLDVEPGAATIGDVRPFVTTRKRQGYNRPSIYASSSVIPSVKRALSGMTATRDYDLWAAHWTGSPHRDDVAAAVQYMDVGPYDLSVVWDAGWPHRARGGPVGMARGGPVGRMATGGAVKAPKQTTLQALASQQARELTDWRPLMGNPAMLSEHAFGVLGGAIKGYESFLLHDKGVKTHGVRALDQSLGTVWHSALNLKAAWDKSWGPKGIMTPGPGPLDMSSNWAEPTPQLPAMARPVTSAFDFQPVRMAKGGPVGRGVTASVSRGASPARVMSAMSPMPAALAAHAHVPVVVPVASAAGRDHDRDDRHCDCCNGKGTSAKGDVTNNITYDIDVSNPAREPASTSIAHEIHKVSFLAGRQMA